jgi:hypothetical protein
MENREFTRRYIAFVEKWMEVSCVGIVLIVLIIIVANLIW